MSKKAVYSMVLFVVFMGVLGVSFNVHEVEAVGTITIKADGSIEGTTDIMTVDNVTYIFTANINDSIVVERNNITIDGAGYTLQGAGSEIGIYLLLRSNVTIKNMEIKNFWAGIQLSFASHNTISGNNITANDYYGIYITYASHNTISGNNITEPRSHVSPHPCGIFLEENSGNNIISGNNIVGFLLDGILGEGSSNNIISGNTIKDTLNGIWLDGGSNNRIYHNNFINHAVDYYCLLSTMLDAGYPLGGNYWDKYNGADLFSGQYQNETGSDGIGDSWHEIDENNIDYYPLMGMYYSFNVSWVDFGHVVDLISNSTVSAFDVAVWIEHPEDPNNRIMKFNVTGENGTAGFCRICIPKALMNETYRVLVNGTEVACNILSCSNNTHKYLYFNYTLSTQEVMIIPEFPTFLIMSLFMTSTLIAALLCTRKLKFPRI